MGGECKAVAERPGFGAHLCGIPIQTSRHSLVLHDPYEMNPAIRR